LLQRTYGGATISPFTSEPSIGERGVTLVEERARIGKAAANRVAPGQVLMIDGGSTTYQAACRLAQHSRDLVVVTNAIAIASVMGANPTMRVILCPGAYDAREGGVFGEDTVDFIGRYNADVAIIGASGLSPEGPCDAVSGSAAVKRIMIRRSAETMLVVDQTKFGRPSLERICAYANLSAIVTDAEMPAPLASAARTAGVEIVVAP
jgi:DeoR family transcriptional regulator, glycerol-3-phosphate regulon repressor